MCLWLQWIQANLCHITLELSVQLNCNVVTKTSTVLSGCPSATLYYSLSSESCRSALSSLQHRNISKTHLCKNNKKKNIVVTVNWQEIKGKEKKRPFND